MLTALATKADNLLHSHLGDRPLVLPNAWDVASARVLEEAGFPVVATSSQAFAGVLGFSDNNSSDPNVIFDLIGRMARAVECPVTADLEAGYGLAPSELVERMLSAGIVGCNLEDSDHQRSGELVDSDKQAEFLADMRTAAETHGIHVVINARVDCFIRKAGNADEQLAEGINRARCYLEASADCVYPITLADRPSIERFVSAVPGSVNIQARQDCLDIDELSKLGVHRVSLASGLFNLMNEQLRTALGHLVSGSLRDVWFMSAPASQP